MTVSKYIPIFLDTWQPALGHDDPVEGLCEFFMSMCDAMVCSEAVCGCPLNNLCEEMANVNEGFRLRILSMQEKLNTLIVESLERVKSDLRENITLTQVAYFIVATFYGATTLCKGSRNKALFQQVMLELCVYIRALKQ